MKFVPPKNLVIGMLPGVSKKASGTSNCWRRSWNSRAILSARTTASSWSWVTKTVMIPISVWIRRIMRLHFCPVATQTGEPHIVQNHQHDIGLAAGVTRHGRPPRDRLPEIGADHTLEAGLGIARRRLPPALGGFSRDIAGTHDVPGLSR